MQVQAQAQVGGTREGARARSGEGHGRRAARTAEIHSSRAQTAAETAAETETETQNADTHTTIHSHTQPALSQAAESTVQKPDMDQDQGLAAEFGTE